MILMDDQDRENEGDLIVAAEKVQPDHVTFFARHACGLICLAIEEQRARQLQLGPMVQKNTAPHATNFTVSIEAARNVTTGISAADRARTVQVAVKPDAGPQDIVTPGHIFPLVARPGGVLIRAGHTEAGCDLARLAGMEPAAMIVEIMNEDGTMATRPDLERFARQHDLRISSIADLIRYRVLHDKTVECLDQREITTEYGEFKLYTYRDLITGLLHLALARGPIQHDQPCLVRVQSISTLRDLLATSAPELRHSWSLPATMRFMAREEASGAVIVILDRHESDEHLLEHIRAFPSLPPPPVDGDSAPHVYRQIGTGSQILRDIGVGKMRLLNSPIRFSALSGFGLEIVEFIEND